MDAVEQTMIKALVDGQIKLAEWQAKLAEGQTKMEASIERLAEGQTKMEASIERLADKVSFMAERLDHFGEQVLRGFTQAAQRDGDLDQRVSKLEAEMETLKNQPRQDS